MEYISYELQQSIRKELKNCSSDNDMQLATNKIETEVEKLKGEVSDMIRANLENADSRLVRWYVAVCERKFYLNLLAAYDPAHIAKKREASLEAYRQAYRQAYNNRQNKFNPISTEGEDEVD